MLTYAHTKPKLINPDVRIAPHILMYTSLLICSISTMGVIIVAIKYDTVIKVNLCLFFMLTP